MSLKPTGHRCTAQKSDLDGDESRIPRSHKHTDMCIDALDGNIDLLWDAYGIIGDVIVSYLPFRYPALF